MAKILTILFVALATCSIQAHAVKMTSAELPRPEGPRHYLLATPEQAASGKRPLVIVLHGHTGSASQVFGREHGKAPMQEWLAIADREQVLVIAPDGAIGSDGKSGWNDCRADAPSNPHTDDVGFIGALIDKAVADHNADRSRVYVIGMSNGGGMAYRLAVDMPSRLAGIAAVSAPWPANSLCPTPHQALPVLIVHGTADKIVPYAGGEVGGFLLHGRGAVPSVADTLAVWRTLDKVPTASADTAFAHRNPSDKTSAQRFVWGDDSRRLQVEFIKIEGGGHTEPSMRHRMQWAYTALLGAQNGDVETAEEAWTFFKDKRVEPAP